jgi:signal transduction histidine kinase
MIFTYPIHARAMLSKGQSIYWYLGTGFVLALGAVIALVAYASQLANQQSRQTQQDMARYITLSRYVSTEQRLMPMIYWQDAYNRMSKGWDKKWIEWEFGPYLESMQINACLLFDSKGKLIQLHQDKSKSPMTFDDAQYSENVVNLLDAIRTAPRSSPPQVRTAMVQLHGVQYFAAAGRVAPEDPKTFSTADKDVTAIFLVRATPASYQALFDSFHLTGVEIRSDSVEIPGKVNILLHDLDGDVVGRLWWIPYEPSNELMRVVVPLTVLVFLLFGVVQMAIIRRWQESQRELGRAQARADAALEESRAKSAFIGTISHELRTPLNAVIGFSELLMSKIFGPLGARQYGEYAEHIHTSGTTLLGIVNDVIEISRIQGRDTGVDCVPCDAVRLVRDAIESKRSFAASKQITIEFVTAEPALWCQAAPTSLVQTVARLIDNAIKFSPERTLVSVELRRGADVEVVVSDQGMGIDEQLRKDLGRPFVQLEGHLARKNGGIGLGLAISRGLAELMGGSLSIDSEPGEGTRVILRLRTAEKPAAEKAAA